MRFEDKLNEISKKHYDSFVSISKSYHENCSGNNSSLSEWNKKRKEIEEKLDREIQRIHEPRFRYYTESEIKKNESSKVPEGYDFAKFCYFIDRLNKEKVTKTIQKYNRTYCHGIAEQIAIEYLRIKHALKHSLKLRGALNQKEYDKALKQFHDLWFDIVKKEVSQIVQEDFRLTMEEIERSL